MNPEQQTAKFFDAFWCQGEPMKCGLVAKLRGKLTGLINLTRSWQGWTVLFDRTEGGEIGVVTKGTKIWDLRLQSPRESEDTTDQGWEWAQLPGTLVSNRGMVDASSVRGNWSDNKKAIWHREPKVRYSHSEVCGDSQYTKATVWVGFILVVLFYCEPLALLTWPYQEQ